MTTGVLFVGLGASTGVAEDLEQGFVDRLRSLPIPRASVLAGRALADTAVPCGAWSITVAIGLRGRLPVHGSVLDGLLRSGSAWCSGSRSSGCSCTLGMFAGNAQAAQGDGVAGVPAHVRLERVRPGETMPGWLQAFAEHQPVTYMVDAVRSLTLGPGAAACSVTRRRTSWPDRCCGRRCSSWCSRRSRWPASGGAEQSIVEEVVIMNEVLRIEDGGREVWVARGAAPAGGCIS